MTLHTSTFRYLEPSDDQLATMLRMRDVAHEYARSIEVLVPEGPDKTYILRKFREVAMWVNIAITRNADGSPRVE
jgi:hypothetical protein